MQTLPTKDFLIKKLGLIRGNPFSDTQAEEEEQLSKYFVDLPAFYKILDIDMRKPKSSILSASRGCGKSANRRNVERWLTDGPKQGSKGKWAWKSPVLVVSYTDFSRLKILIDGDFSKTQPEDHVSTILWFCISSFLEYLAKIWTLDRPKEIPSWNIFQLGYFLVNYTTKWAHLKSTPKDANPDTVVSLNQNLDSFLYAVCQFAKNAEYLALGGASGLLQGFKDVTNAFGIRDIAILVDGVDELELTANNPRLGAVLLKSLIAERSLMQLDGVYFKFFLPSEVVFELKKMPEARIGERITVYEMLWDEISIRLLLTERLKAFSNGTLRDLGQIASVDVKDVSRSLAAYANNNPRNLIRLCNYLLIQLEQSISKSQITEKNQKPKITRKIIDEAVKSFENDTMYFSTYSTLELKAGVEYVPLFSAFGWEVTHDLKVVHKGNIISAEKLDPKEYKIFSYLVEHAGEIVKREDLGEAVWKEKWVAKYGWVLNQTILRLRKKIGHGRIETVRGIGYKFHTK